MSEFERAFSELEIDREVERTLTEWSPPIAVAALEDEPTRPVVVDIDALRATAGAVVVICYRT